MQYEVTINFDIPCTRDGGSQPHVEGFMPLWDSIIASRGFGWDTNPFVWVLEFRRVQP